MALVTLDIAVARFPQWRPNSIWVELCMSRLRIVAVPSAHTEGMYLTLPHFETCFRICKVFFQIIQHVCFQIHLGSEVGKRTFSIHSSIARSSITAATSPHASPALSLPVNSVGGTTDKSDEAYLQPNDVWCPVVSTTTASHQHSSDLNSREVSPCHFESHTQPYSECKAAFKSSSFLHAKGLEGESKAFPL